VVATVGTTHAGGGHPRLVVSYGGAVLVDDEPGARGGEPDVGGVRPNEIELAPGTTTIGSGAGSDLRLEGLDDQHAIVVLSAGDEYVLVDRSLDGGTRVNGLVVSSTVEQGHPLRTGDRVELGPWVLAYMRDEAADHGRPYGGRQGGEGSLQQGQPPAT
jgi:hypothetical protein